jgi:hypothetical protein
MFVMYPKDQASIARIENNVDERLLVGIVGRQLLFQNQPQSARWIVSESSDHYDDNEEQPTPSHEPRPDGIPISEQV